MVSRNIFKIKGNGKNLYMLSEEDKMIKDYKEKAKLFNSYVGSVVSKKKKYVFR